jgi:hypothetical protein
MAMDVAPLAPRATETAAGVPSVKSLALLFTVSDTDVVRDSVPEVAVIVTGAVPSVAVLEALNVAVTELPVVAVDGLKVTVTPAGSPLALIDTAPVKLVRLMATEVFAVAPRTTLTDAGVAETV